MRVFLLGSILFLPFFLILFFPEPSQEQSRFRSKVKKKDNKSSFWNHHTENKKGKV